MDNPTPRQVGPGYAVGRMAKALTTALTHEDPRVREAAHRRVDSWERVVTGMREGTLSVGSRTPVRGLPAERAALYAHHLTEEGLAELTALLDGGGYEVDLPEQAALLTVAWLLRAGDTAGALRLLSAIDPLADTLCLTPRPAPRQDLPANTVFRETVGDARRALERRARRDPATVRPKVQQEALAVWNPFADRLLSHWLETYRDGRVDAQRPPGWTERGAALLAEYERLAAEHTLCTKHRRPKENLAILLAALREAVTPGGGTGREGGRGTELTPRRLGLLQHAAESMVARRGLPGSDRHTLLRTGQAEHAARPTHDVLAALLSARLAPMPQNSGAPGMEEALAPTLRREADDFAVPEGCPIPDSLSGVARRATAAPLDDLVELGVVPSAEVMAEIVPALTAAAEAASADDPALARLVAAHHRAFGRRRSLLLLDLASQVRANELPWVQELLPHRAGPGARREAVSRLLPELGASVLAHFPGTIVPNPMVRELDGLSRAAGLGLPFVEELAADIFTGEFVPKFPRAAKIAAELLEDGLYARYYGIDYTEVLALPEERPLSGHVVTPFARLCRERAGNPRGGVASSGTVIEQAQILTTHNLATLVGAGARPECGWAELARRAHALTVRTVERLPLVHPPLPHVKNAAFSWRQTVFFLSLCPEREQREAMALMEGLAPGQPHHTRERLAPVLAGLRQVVDGGPLREEVPGGARRFLGWSAGPHWMLQIAPRVSTRSRGSWG
ncbi:MULTISPECIES: transcriptional regulator [Nocardiopsis]|uniref:Transcriptional regulator n=1 Tax=Nocardiopsis sinuspersici TaxID=501010 RepID=A0A1V3C0E5_9ACTN|nr:MULTISPECIES: transcriptional regulator [Nocardiopsis]OOC54158.1 transcriptional regulator [Nocardiopsis sinuspersici]